MLRPGSTTGAEVGHASPPEREFLLPRRGVSQRLCVSASCSCLRHQDVIDGRRGGAEGAEAGGYLAAVVLGVEDGLEEGLFDGWFQLLAFEDCGEGGGGELGD